MPTDGKLLGNTILIVSSLWKSIVIRKRCVCVCVDIFIFNIPQWRFFIVLFIEFYRESKYLRNKIARIKVSSCLICAMLSCRVSCSTLVFHLMISTITLWQWILSVVMQQRTRVTGDVLFVHRESFVLCPNLTLSRRDSGSTPSMYANIPGVQFSSWGLSIIKRQIAFLVKHSRCKSSIIFWSWPVSRHALLKYGKFSYRK